ncbi:hypothetical protein [Streptomyces sp. NPDC008125]
MPAVEAIAAGPARPAPTGFFRLGRDARDQLIGESADPAPPEEAF